VAVAELAFGLILGPGPPHRDNVAQLREGKWNKGEFSKARGIFGRTLGLIDSQDRPGDGSRARAFGLRVAAWSGAYPPKPRRGSASSAWSLRRRLAARSDIVSVHLALTSGTRQLLSTLSSKR